MEIKTTKKEQPTKRKTLKQKPEKQKQEKQTPEKQQKIDETKCSIEGCKRKPIEKIENKDYCDVHHEKIMEFDRILKENMKIQMDLFISNLKMKELI